MLCIIIGEQKINKMTIKKVDSFCDYVKFPVTKCLMVGDGDILENIETKLKEDEEIVNWAIENVGLTKYKNTPVSALSGGERQRAHLAQALCQKPEILLLDEPTTYLDISHQLELMELVREINKNLNITIIMVLHDLNQASKYSDRLVIMKNGNIVADGHPNETISHDIIRDVYGVKCDIDHDSISKKPRIHPIETIKAIV